ncbi:MAG: PHP domain-containing protein [Desulfovibrio sp.]|jgi:predicted metal-dependent phosphoesterase TrpH|nr:PHP domain-containing protein [Desulfovibrio sp.]
MLIDLHAHEYLYSPCSGMSLREAVEAARNAGLDALCITDHGSMDIRKREAALLRNIGFPVFIGVEMYTRQGDVIAFGLDSLPPAMPTSQEFADFVAARNGFCFAAHPFRSFGGGLGDALYAMRNLNGVEVLNGADSEYENGLAVRACRELGLIPVAGSDAHRPEDVGRCATWFPDAVASEWELTAALRAGKGRPAVRGRNGAWHRLAYPMQGGDEL